MNEIRPKRDRRSDYMYANILVVVLVLVSGGLASFLYPKPTVSEIEKRKLAQKPEFSIQELFRGNYTRDMEAFYADTFPAREMLVKLSFFIDNIKGMSLSGGQIYDPVQPPAPVDTAPPSSLPEDSGESSQSQSEPEKEQPVNDGYTSHGLFVYDGSAYSLFGRNTWIETYYANTISKYADNLPDVNVYNLLIPTAGEFYIPQKYSNIWNPQIDSIESIYSQLSDRVTAVDAYSQLKAHKDEYLYFRTDHHWTARGAYYAYYAFAKAAGFTPVPLSDMDARTLPDSFLGTQYNLTQDGSLARNPDKLDYFIVPSQYKAYMYMKDQPYAPYAMQTLWAEYAKGSNSYSLFLHGDQPLIRVDTNAGTGRKILMVKESFGNSFAPYLISHFDQVFIADQRYFQTAAYELIKNNGITDVLFINNIFAANTKYHVDCISRLGNQVWTPPPPPEEEGSVQEESESSDVE